MEQYSKEIISSQFMSLNKSINTDFHVNVAWDRGYFVQFF